MADSETPPDNIALEPPQSLLGYLSNDDWNALLVHVNGLVQEMDHLPAGDIRDRVFELLDSVDAIHREALHRLVRLFKEGVLEKVISDPAIHTLMELYDLLPPEAEVQGSGGHKASTFPTIPIKPVRVTPATPARFPHWVPVPNSPGDLMPGAVREVEVDGYPILICRRDDQLFALESRCARDGGSLHQATVSSYTLTCPNHPGCYYDVRQGSRLGGSEKITCYPVKLDANGRVLIGLDMEFTPNLPSF